MEQNKSMRTIAQGFCVVIFLIFLFITTQSSLANKIESSTKSWSFSSSSDYMFDSSKIQIGSGIAQLKTPDDWYNSDWKYRKEITIDNTSNSSALTDYQVKIALINTNFDFSKAKSDGLDIRFTDSDGTTSLDYWIEDYDSVGETATIWPKVPSIPALSTKTIYLYYGNTDVGSYYKLTIDSATHTDYGAAYPMTYEFSIPSGSSSLKAYRKYTKAQDWTQITEKTSDDLFNGVEAVRFDYANNKAYVSTAYSNDSDNIFLEVRDNSGISVNLDYVGITDYYDNREATVTSTGDDWFHNAPPGEVNADSANDTGFKAAADAFTSRHMWFTAGMNTGTHVIYGWVHPDWNEVQEKIDAGYLEMASHTANHPHPPYADSDAEVGGSKTTLIDNLDLPYKKGVSEYFYCFIQPYGQSDGTSTAEVGAHKYLVERNTSENFDSYGTTFANNHYNASGSLWLENSNLSAANSKFDSVAAAHGIYHIMMHPRLINWSTNSWANQHLDYIKEKKNIWYTGFGYLYLYHYIDDKNKVMAERFGESDESIADPEFQDGFTGTELNPGYWTSEKNGGNGTVTVSDGYCTIDPQNNTINSIGIKSTQDGFTRFKTNIKSTAIDNPYLTISIGTGSIVSLGGDKNQSTFSNGYVFRVSTNTNAKLYKMTGGSYSELDSYTTALDILNFHEYEIIIDGLGVSVERDGIEILSSSDTTYSSGYALIMGGEYSTGAGDTTVIDWATRQYTMPPDPSPSNGTEVRPYPTDDPVVYSKTAQAFTSLSSFSETATKDSGEIKYQISNNGGSTWYWYNSGWKTTSSTYVNANTASEINSYITSFPVGDGSFLFKAYLHSDGTQLVQLDSINLGYINDTTAPVISNISSNPSDSEVTISWTTNEAASSQVDYGNSNSYGDSTSEVNTSTRVTSHEITIYGLNVCSTYHFRVRSKDALGNEGVSGDHIFTTTGCSDSSDSSDSGDSNIGRSELPGDSGIGDWANWYSSLLPENNNDTMAIPSNSVVGSSIIFDGETLFPGKDIVKYFWDFGDGTTLEGKQVEHLYTAPGRYKVTVTGYDRRGNKWIVEETIDINPKAPVVENVVSDDTNLSISGTGYPGDDIYLTIHSDPIEAKTKIDKDGKWSYKLSNASEVIDKGEHTIIAREAFPLDDGTELESDSSKKYSFSVNIDNGKLKIEMDKTNKWRTTALILSGIIIIGLLALILRKKYSGHYRHSSIR